jgi:hypothetical protein
MSLRFMLLRPIQNNIATSIHDKLAKGVSLSAQRRMVKRQLDNHDHSMDGRARFGDASAIRASVVAKRFETLSAQLGLGASREHVPNGRAVRVALRFAALEPPYFHSTDCSHCGWFGGLARCCICHAALCSWHRILAHKAGRCNLGRPQSATACVCSYTGGCIKRSWEFADAIRKLDGH